MSDERPVGRDIFHEPHPDSIWECPCGFQSRYASVRSHRKGFKLRPRCAAGKIFMVSTPEQSSPSESPTSPGDTPDPPASPPPTGASSFSSSPETEEPEIPTKTGWEYTGDSWPEGLDAEEIARLINLRRQGRADGDPGPDPFFGDGDATPVDGLFGTNGTTGGNGGAPPTIDGDLFGGGDIPGGDWKVIPPGPDPAISQRNETVLLPPAARLMYDWARAPAPSGGGWHQGDGSFSAFVWDALFDHFRHCWGKRIVVIDQTEVSVG